MKVAQESFLRFYRLCEAGEIRRHERALLFRLVRNLAFDRPRLLFTSEQIAGLRARLAKDAGLKSHWDKLLRRS